MGISIKVIYGHNGRKNVSGVHSVYIRVTIDRVSKLYSTGVKLPEGNFQDKELKWVKDKFPSAFYLNNIIKQRRDKMVEYIRRRESFQQLITFPILSEFWKLRSEVNFVNDYVKAYLKIRKFEAYRTKQKYKTFEKHLNEYQAKLPFNALDETVIKGFVQYLKGINHNPDTIDRYLQCFRTVITAAVKDGYLERDPFFAVNIKLEKHKPKSIWLTVNDIISIKEVDLQDSLVLDRTRKHFLFCLYAGIYYSDLRALTWSDIKYFDDGFVYIDSLREKNKEAYQSPIGFFSHATEILKLQKGLHDRLVFPDAIEEQPFNRNLKKLAILAKIDKPITNRTARKSFIQLMQGYGCPMQFTSKMAGHTKLETTQKYYQTTLLEVRDFMKTVNSPLFN